MIMGQLEPANEFGVHANLPAKEFDPQASLPSTDVRPVEPSALGNAELLRTITEQVGLLAKKEVELARAEATVDMQAELELTKGFAIATICGIIAINLFIMSMVLLFAPEHAWLACLILAVVLVAVGGGFAYYGWKNRATDPMNNTIDSLKEMGKWVKERVQ